MSPANKAGTFRQAAGRWFLSKLAPFAHRRGKLPVPPVSSPKEVPFAFEEMEAAEPWFYCHIRWKDFTLTLDTRTGYEVPLTGGKILPLSRDKFNYVTTGGRMIPLLAEQPERSLEDTLTALETHNGAGLTRPGFGWESESDNSERKRRFAD
jgi:hypothetical protein